MKKIFMSALVIGTASLNFAQKTTFGVKGGVNISSVSNLYESTTKSRVGFNAGIFANVSVSEKFKIQPEVLYSQKGLVYPSGKEEYGYLSVPVMFQYNLIEKFYLEAGPEFSFLLSAKDKQNEYSNSSYYYSAGVYDVKDEYRTFDFGLGFGIGYDIVKNFGINARYITSLTNLYKESDPGDVAKNSAFQIGLFYKFK